MGSFRAYMAAIAAGMIIAACGGSSSTIADVADSGGASNSDGAAGDSAGNAETGTGSDGNSADGNSADGNTPAEAGRDAAFLGDSALTLDGNDGGGCPNTLGGYAPLVATGMGCGDFNSSVKQCILPVAGSVSGSNACNVRFNSEQPATIPAVNGPQLGVDIKTDGTFDNAALRLGTNPRTGCVGSFDEAAQTMTVNCGGTGTSQSCTITLVRSSVTCP